MNYSKFFIENGKQQSLTGPQIYYARSGQSFKALNKPIRFSVLSTVRQTQDTISLKKVLILRKT